MQELISPTGNNRTAKLRSTLLMVILATIPCYCLGVGLLFINEAQSNRPTATITSSATFTQTVSTSAPQVASPTASFTPTITRTWTPSMTFTPFRTPTRTETPEPSKTATPTLEPPTDTPIPPTDTAAPTNTETLIPAVTTQAP